MGLVYGKTIVVTFSVGSLLSILIVLSDGDNQLQTNYLVKSLRRGSLLDPRRSN